jgi:RimJ/RimL family protein N-acetyltransferase
VAQFVTRQDLRYHAHDKDTGAFIAGSGLHRIDWSVPSFEIGYWCRTSKTARGYVTEIVGALTRLAFEQLGAARVQIRCDNLNTRSAKVAETCGFLLEGICVNDARATDGSLRSTRVYALTRNV